MGRVVAHRCYESIRGDMEQGGNNGDEGDKHKSKLSIMRMRGEVVT